MKHYILMWDGQPKALCSGKQKAIHESLEVWFDVRYKVYQQNCSQPLPFARWMKQHNWSLTRVDELIIDN